MNRKSKIIICIFILLSLIGCKSKGQNKQTLKKKDVSPESLRELSKEMGSIMDYMGDIEKIDLEIEVDDEEEKNKQDNSKEISTQNEEGNKEKPKEGTKEETKEEPKEKSKEETKEESTKEEIKNEKIKTKWEEVDKMLEHVHKSWNDYQVKAIKKGSTIENGDEAEDSLNKLTKAIEDREVLSVYNHGSRVFKSLKPFYELYTDEIGGELSNLKYRVYQYYINAIKDSKNTALVYISGSDEDINKIRYKLEKTDDKKQDLDKVDIGFKSLSNALDEKSRRLFILKKDTLIENLNSLEN